MTRDRRHDPKRGRHKRATSPETRTWEREHLIPERPVWMDAKVYESLARVRASCDAA